MGFMLAHPIEYQILCILLLVPSIWFLRIILIQNPHRHPAVNANHMQSTRINVLQNDIAILTYNYLTHHHRDSLIWSGLQIRRRYHSKAPAFEIHTFTIMM